MACAELLIRFLRLELLDGILARNQLPPLYLARAEILILAERTYAIYSVDSGIIGGK